MPFDHLFWTYAETDHACLLGGLENFDDDYLIGEGEPAAADYPSDAQFRMDTDGEWRLRTLTTDFLENGSTFVVVSQRTVDLLQAQKVPDVEYLPVTILDHRLRPTPTPYHIVNAVNRIALLDRAASLVTETDLGDIASYERFALVPDANDKDLPDIFRIAELPSYVLVSRRLAEQIKKLGLTGHGFIEPNRLAGKLLHPSLKEYVGR